jgi:hypothetical protein
MCVRHTAIRTRVFDANDRSWCCRANLPLRDDPGTHTHTHIFVVGRPTQLQHSHSLVASSPPRLPKSWAESSSRVSTRSWPRRPSPLSQRPAPLSLAEEQASKKRFPSPHARRVFLAVFFVFIIEPETSAVLGNRVISGFRGVRAGRSDWFCIRPSFDCDWPVYRL